MAKRNGFMSKLLEATSIGFDAAAPTYDEDFSHTTFGQLLRRRFYEMAVASFAETGRLLDIGCGTGQDAAFFSRNGWQVTGVDASPGMLRMASAKQLPNTNFQAYALPGQLPFSDSAFDGIYSHLGALNCLPPDDHPIQELNRVLKPGGILILSLMNRIYPAEIIGYLLLLSPRKAFRRFGRQPVKIRTGESMIPVWYPRKQEILSKYQPVFSLRDIAAQPVLIPPAVLTNKLPLESRLITFFFKADRILCRLPGIRMLGDHTLYLFQKRRAL